MLFTSLGRSILGETVPSVLSTDLLANNIYLSHKLRCYAGISGPEKSRNNTHEEMSYFFTCVDKSNQLLTHHSPLALLGQVDEWKAKPSRFSIQVVCRNFLELRRPKHKKIRISNRQWGSNFHRRGRKTVYKRKNRKLRTQWL